MLIYADASLGSYTIAVNNSSDNLELVSDFSYIAAAPIGSLVFDFSHMAAPLTQEKRQEYFPGGYGYQPTHQLLEVVGTIANYIDNQPLRPRQLVARVPSRNSRVGKYLFEMQLLDLLQRIGLQIGFIDPASTEIGFDDSTRKNLIPFTFVTVSDMGPDFKVLVSMRARIEATFRQALQDDLELANRFTSIVDEAVDNLIEYGEGGIIGGLYYPRIGEVEITLVNRSGGFGGRTPNEQLEALVSACEGKSARRYGGGNGIAELSRLSSTCFGTLLLRNGNATLILTPDGTIAGDTSQTGIPLPGAAVTIVLQLLPASSVERNETMRRYESVVIASLNTYMNRQGANK